MTFVPKDVVLLPESTGLHPDRWVAMNVFARTALGIDSDVARLLGTLESRNAAANARGPFRCWEIERFSNEDGLLADPSRFVRNVADWRELSLDRDAMLAKLKTHFIVVDDEAEYRARFQLKRNLLDKDHFGNFHQQHGQYMMLLKRVNPADWWMKQKFTPDYLSVRSDTLYGAVQARFLESYMAQRIRPGMTVVDLGCGTGIYANLMAKHGASVLGVDPSDEYLAVAKANAAPGTRFENMKIGESGGLDAVPTASADMVFMSDALLFYFVPFFPGQKADIQALLAAVRRILKNDGVFVSLEPHGAFYLTPWLGAPDRPFTIVTEYMHRWFGVVPPLAQLIQAFVAAGFAITDLQEIEPAGDFAKVDSRAYHFAREFPLWQLIELRSPN
jgi:SAM-dependent methyltransferase